MAHSISRDECYNKLYNILYILYNSILYNIIIQSISSFGHFEIKVKTVIRIKFNENNSVARLYILYYIEFENDNRGTYYNII